LSAFAISIILVRIVLPIAVRHASEALLLCYAMFVAASAFCLFPLFREAWALAAVSFLLGIGCGCGQPLSMTLVYNASPPGRAGEATGMRIMVNQVSQLAIPLLFGGLGLAAGFTAMFLANAGCLVAGGVASLRHQARRPS
jgi:MFS family permease